MPRCIWSSPGNPPKSVAQQLGIERSTLGDRLHKIKAASGLGGADHVRIYDDGMVVDANGEEIGNLYDED